VSSRGRGGGPAEPSLRCPACGREQPATERFCPDCRLPLTAVGPDEFAAVSERHERARKIKPQLAEGPLVRVAGARNQAEGEMLQGLLLEAGVPSLLRRSAGFDVPDFLAAGPRDLLVPQSGAATAREVLLEAEILGPGSAVAAVSPGRLLAGLLIAVAVVALVIWLLSVAVR
jgi:hypothetical protein